MNPPRTPPKGLPERSVSLPICWALLVVASAIPVMGVTTSCSGITVATTGVTAVATGVGGSPWLVGLDPARCHQDADSGAYNRRQRSRCRQEGNKNWTAAYPHLAGSPWPGRLVARCRT